jgi:hypothetical protein
VRATPEILIRVDEVFTEALMVERLGS